MVNVNLIYARPGVDCIELCIQDSMGYKVYPLPYSRALILAKQVLNLVTWPSSSLQFDENYDDDTVIYESNVGWIDGHD